MTRSTKRRIAGLKRSLVVVELTVIVIVVVAAAVVVVVSSISKGGRSSKMNKGNRIDYLTLNWPGRLCSDLV